MLWILQLFKINWLKCFITVKIIALCGIFSLTIYLINFVVVYIFFLRCSSFNINKIPLCLSNFHKQVFLQASLLTKKKKHYF